MNSEEKKIEQWKRMWMCEWKRMWMCDECDGKEWDGKNGAMGKDVMGGIVESKQVIAGVGRWWRESRNYTVCDDPPRSFLRAHSRLEVGRLQRNSGRTLSVTHFFSFFRGTFFFFLIETVCAIERDGRRRKDNSEPIRRAAAHLPIMDRPNSTTEAQQPSHQHQLAAAAACATAHRHSCRAACLTRRPAGWA